MIFNQVSFLGGIGARFDNLRPDKSDYPILVNGRVRKNAIETIRKPLQDTRLPAGIYQNVTAVGSILMVFISGECWYRDTYTNNGWRRVSGFQLDATVDVIDTADLPASTINYKRSGPIDVVKFNNSPARSTAEGFLATDGVTQPMLVYPVIGGIISARATFTYAQWIDTTTGELREYVPIGRFPVFVGQKLYMAINGVAGYLNRIAQSVSGRPLDFVIAIDEVTGDKDGDALSTAHAVGFDPINGLYKTSSLEAFIVGTANNVYGVTPDYSDTRFFGEPALRNAPLFPVGVLNNKCAVDLNGDSAFITPTGIHSFNAVFQQKNASNNDPVSIGIHNLLNTVQTYGATADFQDYAFFAVETIFGPGVAVYDKTLGSSAEGMFKGERQVTGKFVSIDLYGGIGQIKQYARTSAPTGNRLFFITQDNRLFEYDAGADRETCRYYIGEWNAMTGKVVQNFRRAFVVFSDVYDPTTVQVTQYADREQVAKASYALEPADRGTAPVIPVPYRMSSGQANGLVHYESADPRNSFAVGLMVEWASEARLVYATLETNEENVKPSSLSQTGLAAAQPSYTKFAMVGDMVPGPVTEQIMKLDQDTVVVGMGDFLYGNVPADDWLEYADFIPKLIAQGRWYAVAGEVDQDYDGGLIVRAKITNGKRYENYRLGDVELFMYNAGWDTADLGSPNPVNEPDGNTATSTQGQWLKAKLAASTARFKFVIMHEGPYLDGNYSPGYPALRLPFRTWGATAVIYAHDHSYQRFILDGLNYVVAGTGGVGVQDLLTVHQAGYQAGRTTFGYLSLEIDSFNATIKHVGVDGTVFDQFVIHT